MRRPLFIYLAVILTFGLGIWALLEAGKRLEPPRLGPLAASNSGASGASSGLLESAGSNLAHPLGRLLLQLIVIVLTARLAGMAIRRIGQPPVIGEIVAGIVLGPSVFGALSPQWFGFLFEKSSLGMLKLLAEIGVLLFLFVVGLELDVSRLRSRAHTAVVVSHASIIVPYFLGVALSFALYSRLAPPNVSFAAFALFLGIAMSITAFPVLVRILNERGLSGTFLGNTAVTCAAVDDVTAWSLLAAVVAIAGARGFWAAVQTIVLAVAFIVLMLSAVGPWLRRAIGRRAQIQAPGKSVIAAVLLLLLACALTTEVIGIHALFGAFLAGVVMPRRTEFRAYLSQRLEEFSSIFLLPLFFAFTGLRTQIGLLNDAESWLLCLLIIVVATAGKLGGSMLGARLTGMGWIESFELGALMNTRGLMELIALNVGYELGILSPKTFAMMVLMALATTFATGPLLAMAERVRRQRPAAASVPSEAGGSG
jgi:Kef-type K+ transport system membrane component KefB